MNKGKGEIDVAHRRGYILGNIIAQIERYCLASGDPYDEISAWIAELLHPMGQRYTDQLPPMSIQTTGGIIQLSEVEGPSNSHGPTTHSQTRVKALPGGKKRLSVEVRKRMAAAQKKRWVEHKAKTEKPSAIKLYWQNMTEDERKSEMRRRLLKRN